MTQPDNELIQIRREKTEKLRQQGLDPFPARCPASTPTFYLLEHFDQPGIAEKAFTVKGRLMALRLHGKTAFADLNDQSGRMQIYLKLDILGEEKFGLVKLLDLGDFIWVEGTLFKTHTGEITLKVADWGLLAKAFRPMPVVKITEDENGNIIQHDAIGDAEIKYRQRYLHLMTDPDARQKFIARARLIAYLRLELDGRGYVEVETPALQPLYGGANARPFITHHHALNMRLYLRIADELYLKRLLVGGFEKIYEITKDFRNEGIDRTHYPEFTQLELYEAGADYRSMMNLCEEMISGAALYLQGKTKIEYQGRELDLTPPWRRLPIDEALREFAGVTDGLNASHGKLLKRCQALGLPVSAGTSWGNLITELLEACIEPKLWEPTFLCDYPREVSPLAKSNPTDSRLAERFEPFIAGIEMGNAFSEQNDPDEQRCLMEGQMERRAKGDPEAQVLDEDFLSALEYGMPPTGGMGIGIDRLAMIMTDSRSIRDVIMFPQLADDKAERIRAAQEELDEHTQRFFGRKPSDAEKRYYIPILSGSIAGINHEEALDHLRETLLDSTEALEHLKQKLIDQYKAILEREPTEKELLTELKELRDFGADRLEIILKSKPEYQASNPPMQKITITRPLEVQAPQSCGRAKPLRLKINVAGHTQGKAFLAVSLYQGKEKPRFYPDSALYGEDIGGETGKLSGEFDLKEHMLEIVLDRSLSPGEHQMLVGLWLDPYGLPGAGRTLAVSRLLSITLK